MEFDYFIGIDWSGDKSDFQKGISVAVCEKGQNAPIIIKPETKYWSRTNLYEWLNKKNENSKLLVGFDFAFSYPFYDGFSYFPGLKDSPTNVYHLWELINNINLNKTNFYGGGIWNNTLYSQYYNAHSLKGIHYKSRRRNTEKTAKAKIYSPSPTFNCVGPGAVGTGTLAGMRMLNSLKETISIWPFEKQKNNKKSVAVEIFPTYYFRMSGTKPIKKIGYTMEQINQALKYFISDQLPKDTVISGPDQDDADAIISCAALRYFSDNTDIWDVSNVSLKEGWIFGV